MSGAILLAAYLPASYVLFVESGGFIKEDGDEVCNRTCDGKSGWRG